MRYIIKYGNPRLDSIIFWDRKGFVNGVGENYIHNYNYIFSLKICRSLITSFKERYPESQWYRFEIEIYEDN